MKRKTLKKALSAFLSLLMCMMTLLSISTPVFAATTVDAYMVDFPRDGDSNYSATAWGHSATSLMGGWRFLNSKYTTVHSIGTYNGQVSYCIEPGIGQNAGDTLSHKDETFWENYPSHLNPTISPDTIKVLLGRIMQYLTARACGGRSGLHSVFLPEKAQNEQAYCREKVNNTCPGIRLNAHPRIRYGGTI